MSEAETTTGKVIINATVGLDHAMRREQYHCSTTSQPAYWQHWNHNNGMYTGRHKNI